LEKAVSPITRFLHLIGQVTIVFMVLVTVTDVCLRYVFNRPVTGSYELTEFMMAILVFASLGYTMMVRGHVSVDLVVTKLPERIRALLESLTCLVAFVLFAVAAWRNVLQAETAWKRHDVSAELFIPIGPFILFVALGIAALSLVLVVHFVQSLAKAIEK